MDVKYLKNKATGVAWQYTNEEEFNRLIATNDFEEITADEATQITQDFAKSAATADIYNPINPVSANSVDNYVPNNAPSSFQAPATTDVSNTQTEFAEEINDDRKARKASK